MVDAPTSASEQHSLLGRTFGRFELLKVLGTSRSSMVWLARVARTDRELILTLPREQPPDGAALDRWLAQARQAARLDHPHLARCIEVAVHEHWPYVVVDRSHGGTLVEWLAVHPNPPPVEVVGWMCQVLEGLAYAHEAGVAHHDLQLHQLQLSDAGRAQVMALAAASTATAPTAATAPNVGSHRPDAAPAAAAMALRTSGPLGVQRGADHAMLLAADALQAQRAANERDVLACGVMLHMLLTGGAVLDEPDVSQALRRLPPLGREVVRLPWSTVHPIPEALRAIANRSTTGQVRQRYLNARTFLRALQGWLAAEALGRDGLLELMLDRLRTVGALPALPGMAAQVERLSAMDGGQHIEQISHQVLQDMALSFELLREVNSVQVRTTQTIGSEPVLTIRRAISLLGLNGLRHTANGLRLWPGPLSDAGAQALHTLMHQVRLAGCTAQALRPAGYDGEMVYLVAVLQNLGRLLAQYHFPEEAEQIRTLMHSTQRPAGSAGASTSMGAPTAAGWTEAQASYAVLGIDIDALGAAVARHWGLGEEMLRMIRRLPKDLPVRAADNDTDVLRLTASAANEAVDAAVWVDAESLASIPPDTPREPARMHAETGSKTAKPARGSARRITTVAQRYLRSLQLTPQLMQNALSTARESLCSGVPVHDDDAAGRLAKELPSGGAEH